MTIKKTIETHALKVLLKTFSPRIAAELAATIADNASPAVIKVVTQLLADPTADAPMARRKKRRSIKKDVAMLAPAETPVPPLTKTETPLPSVTL